MSQYKTSIAFAACALFAVTAMATPATLQTAMQAGGDRLVSLQNNDGGWDWPLDDGDPANDSPLNTIGPIGMGLAEAYLATGSTTQQAALTTAGNFLLAKTAFSPSDGYLAAQLDAVFGVSTYSAHVQTNFYDKLANGTYNREGTLYDTASYVQRIRDIRSGDYANLAAWDIAIGVVGAAAVGADTSAWLAGTKAELDEIDAGKWYDVLGLAGAVYALSVVDEDYDTTDGAFASAANLSELAEALEACQIDGGGFSWNEAVLTTGNEAIQETAYAMLALNAYDSTEYEATILGAGDFLLNVQIATGGWGYYDGTSENNEVTGEALWALSTVPEPCTVGLLALGALAIAGGRRR